ncbi:hypothetical protein CS8_037240 [Cupriavidus sp. 8B]
MLCDAAANIMASDAHRTSDAQNSQKLRRPVSECRNRRVGNGELAAGTTKAGEIHCDWAQSRGREIIDHWLPHTAPVGAMKQQYNGALLARSQVTCRGACYV